MYAMEIGPIAQDISTQAGNMGRPIPQAIKEQPILQSGNDLYLYAFYDLESERVNGMGIGSIPWSRIDYYATANSFDTEQRIALHHCVAHMDQAYRTHMSKGGK